MSKRRTNVFKRKDGRWEGRFRIGTNENHKPKYKSVYGKSYTECKNKLKDLEVRQEKDFPVSAKDSDLKLDDLFEKWLESKKNSLKLSTYATYKNWYYSYWSVAFGTTKATKITSSMLNSYISELMEKGKQNGTKNGNGLSSKTIQILISLIKRMYAYGEEEFHIPNPTKQLAVPKLHKKEITVFSEKERKKITEAAMEKGCVGMGILLCMYSGLRIGEVCALKWEHIDLEHQLIHVRNTIQRIKNPYGNLPKTVIVIDVPKSSNSIRDIPILQFLIPKLTKMKQNQKDSNYVVTGKSTYTEPRTFESRYKTFLKQCNIPYKNFHVLRHTFATECIKKGADVKTVSELLGHSNVNITLEKYVHSSMEMKRDALEKVFQ